VIRLFRLRPGVPWLLAGALVLLAFAPGDGLAGAALRAGALLGALGAVAAGLRRRAAAAPGLLRVTERQPLGREGGVALLQAGRRTLVIAYGPAGVSVLAELSAEGGP
jgi:Flagellar biosynthesis protein, FliO